MEDELIYEKYHEIACAAIKQAVDDYARHNLMDDYEFYKWCMQCGYFELLDIDRERFYAKALKLKHEKGKKKHGKKVK